jgi:predicted kinase
VERLGAIRIRSDVERKRLFGLSALDSSHSSSGYQGGFDIYSAEATRQTYARLEELVRILLDAGMIVLVDAAFLRRSERTNFQHLAGKMAVPFAIVSILADENLMVERLEARKRRGQDASEADVAVLRVLQAVQEPLGEDENAVFFTNNGREERFQSNNASWALLEARLTV